MAFVKLRWMHETSIFGTNVHMHTKDKSLDEQILTNFEFNPITRLSPRLKTGYFFRSPDIDSSKWQSVFETLNQIVGKINIWAELDTKTKKVTAYAIVEDKSDAAMWAWAQVETFQKWSVAQQEEARAEAKKKPQKIKVNKDGTVTITVTTTTLSGEEDETGLEL